MCSHHDHYHHHHHHHQTFCLFSFYEQLFRGLRCKNPHFDEKVQAIAGDMLVDGLGIGEEDRLLLQDNVNIVIHSAATVKFDEHLRYTYINPFHLYFTAVVADNTVILSNDNCYSGFF